MADNYLEKRMDDYRNGASNVVTRKHKMPKKKVVLVKGCYSQAHLDIVKSLCNGGHQVYVTDVADSLSADVHHTLARFDVPANLLHDSLVVNSGSMPEANGRVILTHCLSDNNQPDVNAYTSAICVNLICYPSHDIGLRLARFVRFLVDSDDDIMNRQIVNIL